jgi:hypothetical protein
MGLHAAKLEAQLDLRLTYRGLVFHLAEQPGSGAWSVPSDLPELTIEQLAAVLQHYPAALLEAVVEFDPICTQFTRDYLADATLSENQRLALVGSVFANAARKYVGSLVLRDVQIQIENNIIADRLATGCPIKEVLTADQERGFALGVGRLFS